MLNIRSNRLMDVVRRQHCMCEWPGKPPRLLPGARPLFLYILPQLECWTRIRIWTNQQKMGIPPEHDIDNSVPRQSQEGRDLLRSKKEGNCGFWLHFLWVLEEFLFSPDEEHFNKKIEILDLLTQLNGTVWKWHCHIFGWQKKMDFFHAHLLQNSHIKTEHSFQLHGIWWAFSPVGIQQSLLIVHLVSSSLLYHWQWN